MYKLSKLLVATAAASMLLLGGCGQDKAADSAEPATTKAQVADTEKNNEHKNEQGKVHLSEDEMQQANIKVVSIQPQQASEQLVFTANIVANQDRIARVSPRVEGRLIKVSANLGDQVKSGQALAVIDSIQVGESRAEYRRAQSELQLAEANFKRSDRLYQEQVVPQRQWLEAKSAYERAQASSRAATEHLRMLGGLSGDGASTFILTAPFSGTVIEKDAVLGELAKPDSSLFTVADLDTVWIEADISEKDLGKMSLGVPAMVTVSAFPNEVFQGKVSYISSMFDRQTRTVKARIELPNPDKKLRIGMFASAKIDLASAREALILPQEAIVLVDGKSTVYLQTDDGFAARAVSTGEQLNNGVIVTDGLEAGDQVVTAGAYTLKSRQLKSQIGDAD